MNDNIRSTARNELSRFLFIAMADKSTQSLMPTCIVDSYWHGLSSDLSTKEFSIKAAEPNVQVTHTEIAGFGKLNWAEKYEENFGRLNPVWFVSPEGKFDLPAYQAYLETGEFIASWDCAPAIQSKITEIKNDFEKLKKISEINRKIEEIEVETGLPGFEKIDSTDILKEIEEKISRFNIDEIKRRQTDA